MKQTVYETRPRYRLGLGGALILTISCLAVARLVMASDSPKPAPVAVTVNEAPLQRNGAFTTSFAPIVKRVAASVVKVNISTKPKTVTAPQGQFGGDEMFRRFFGDQFGGQGGPGRTMHTPREYGIGSGVIISKDGYILTNNHVVDDVDTIKITLNDGREFSAKVIGRDPKTDVAVVKIDAKDLPFVTVADSDKIEVGDVCLAIGNPFGVGQTVTMGIVSATGRGGLGLGTDYEDFIQTDAAINPGNSGGALVDAEGRLIGINTAILSRSGGNQGIGFAVPINLARNVMDSLITNGKVVRGFLGVTIGNLNPALEKAFNVENGHGALVADVAEHSPADKAGFKSGDVILDFNHKAVTDSGHLKLQVAETAPNTSVPVKIIRDGHEKTLTVVLKELPGSEEVADNGSLKANGENDTLNGVTVGDLDPGVKKQLEIPSKVKGAVVTDVSQDSPAFEAGLRPGDVIEEINHKPVASGDDAVKLTENVKDKVTLLKVWSKGGTRFMVVDESKAG